MSNQLLLRRRFSGAKGGRPNYLKFTAQEDGCTVNIYNKAAPTNPQYTYPLEYSLNGGDFVPYTYGNYYDHNDITFNNGDTIEWRRAIGYGSNELSVGKTDFYRFEVHGSVICTGLITSVLRYDGIVQSISDGGLYGIFAVYNDTNLVCQIMLPDTLVDIGERAFASGGSLNGIITIPESVSNLGAQCFYNSSHISAFILLPKTPPVYGSGALVNNTQNLAPIYVPYSSDHSILAAYQSAWSGSANNIYELDENGNIPE